MVDGFGLDKSNMIGRAQVGCLSDVIDLKR